MKSLIIFRKYYKIIFYEPGRPKCTFSEVPGIWQQGNAMPGFISNDHPINKNHPINKIIPSTEIIPSTKTIPSTKIILKKGNSAPCSSRKPDKTTNSSTYSVFFYPYNNNTKRIREYHRITQLCLFSPLSMSVPHTNGKQGFCRRGGFNLNRTKVSTQYYFLDKLIYIQYFDN